MQGWEDGRAGKRAAGDEQLNAAKKKKEKKKAKRNGMEKKSVPCPKGKLLKLGIGALKADRVWITELLSHRI